MERNLRKFKQQVPMPENCPFCGRRLTPQNAEIDHIIPVRLGGKSEPDNLRYVCRECNVSKADKYDPLLEYYIILMEKMGKTDDETKRKIEYLLRNASDKDLTELVERVKRIDPTLRRYMAYYTAFLDIQKTEQETPELKRDMIAESMEERLKDYANYDYKNELRKEINGNIFNYERGFPIEEYADVLSSFGKEEKGEVYSVYLDEDGELVVY